MATVPPNNFLATLLANNPQLQSAQAKKVADAKAKAAYDAIPYATHLANARAALNSARTNALAKFDQGIASGKNPIVPSLNISKMPKSILEAMRNKIPENDPATKAAQARYANLVHTRLRDQLLGQSKQYGFSWKTNKAAEYHAGNVANLIMSGGVTDLSEVGYSKNGKNLINKTTGKPISFYKNRAMDAKGKAQMGWSAKGKGRTNYYVQKDAQGNPVFHPEWKSNAPGGIGGKILKYAAPVIGAVNPLAGAAVGAALGLAQGQKFGDIAKGAALNYGLSTLGRGVSNLATGSLPMIGNAGITNTIADSLGGAAAGGVRGLVTGQNPLQSALTGAATSAVGSGIGQLVGQIPSTGNATLDKFLQAGAQRGLGGAISPVFAGLFDGSGGANTGRGRTNQAGANQNQGNVNGLQGGNALLAGMMLGGINQPQAGRQQVRYQMGDAPKLSFV